MQYALFDIPELLGGSSRVDVEIGFTQKIGRAFEAAIGGKRLIDDDEPALRVLDKEIVRKLVDQCPDERALDFAGPFGVEPRGDLGLRSLIGVVEAAQKIWRWILRRIETLLR